MIDFMKTSLFDPGEVYLNILFCQFYFSASKSINIASLWLQNSLESLKQFFGTLNISS